jgi:hypothetical protein
MFLLFQVSIHGMVEQRCHGQSMHWESMRNASILLEMVL